MTTATRLFEINWRSTCLRTFPWSFQILIDSLGPESNEAALAGSDGFIIRPQCNFVAKFGPDYFDVSMKALDEMTQRFIAEGSIRPFIQKYPEQMRQWLELGLRNPSPPAWRPVSEGTRPRLPLAP
ncbi:MAG: hypothetical protein DPW09_39425 [Anaerolineae bacterium]|nr:hypothetical protein [Anaerolineae bacterium]